MSEKATQEQLILEWWMRVPYKWAAGAYVGKWLEELRDNGKIYANKCPNCGRFFTPARPVCGRCHVRMEEWGKWVEVGPKGTVLSCNVVEQSFWYPTKGEMLRVPFTVGIIQLDGAPTAITHYLEETSSEKLHIGMRVEAVLKPKEQRQGNIFDIIHFRTIKE